MEDYLQMISEEMYNGQSWRRKGMTDK